MENMINKNIILGSFSFNKAFNNLEIFNQSKSETLDKFFYNDKLEKFPFELLEVFKDTDLNKLTDVENDVLWKLNSIDLDIAKLIIKNYSTKSINLLSNCFKNNSLLKKLCNFDSDYIDSLLSLNLHVHDIEFPSNMRSKVDIASEYYLLLIIKFVEYIYNSDDIEKNKSWIKEYLEDDSLRIINRYFNNIYNLKENEILPEYITSNTFNILTSNLFNRLLPYKSTISSTQLKTLWNLLIMNDISEDTLSLIDDIALNKDFDIENNIQLFISILNSEVSFGTRFKYSELKVIYKNDIHTLFTNMISNRETIILQKEINKLLSVDVDPLDPYKAIYGEESIEYKILKSTDIIYLNNSFLIKKLLHLGKSKFLDTVFKYYEEISISNNKSLKSLASDSIYSIFKKYDCLDNLLHLNSINRNQLEQLFLVLSKLDDLTYYLSNEASSVCIPESLCKKYDIKFNTKLYSGEKLNYDEFYLLINNEHSIVRHLMLTLKRIKIKNSRILNICSELSKSNYRIKANDKSIEKITNIALNYNSLYLYREKNPITLSKIKNISNLIYSIIHEDDLIKLNVSLESEIEFLRKKGSSLKEFISNGIRDISSAQLNLCFKDTEMTNVLNSLNVDDNFINENFNNIISFYTNGLSTVVDTLNYKLHGNAFDNLQLIVKAELAGRLKDIKYSPEDYEKEIRLPVSDNQKSLWEKNFSYNDCCEADDFETIIRIGQYPVATCQNWSSSGYHVKSILSNFDTNKKVIVHKDKSGKITTRAILRLTKMTFDYSTYKENNKCAFKSKKIKDLGFKDITKTDTDLPKENKVDLKEELVLFLERGYSYLDPKQAAYVYRDIFKLAKQKADEMGIKLAISQLYSRNQDNNTLLNCSFERKDCYIYVSKSKNGSQYLDSLLGHNESSDSEKYVHTSVYI